MMTRLSVTSDNKCVKCNYYEEEWEGEYGGHYCGSLCHFPNQQHYGNLKSFPFRSGCKNFEIEFWSTEFPNMIGADGDDWEAVNAYRRSLGWDEMRKVRCVHCGKMEANSVSDYCHACNKWQ